MVPRVGLRATYYSQSRNVEDVDFVPSDNPLIPEFILPPAVLQKSAGAGR